MTATMESPTALTATCRFDWCLKSANCTSEPFHSEDLRMHLGDDRYVLGAGGGRIAATANVFTEADGSFYGVPMVTIGMDAENGGQTELELSVEMARAFSAALTTYAAGGVSIGAESTFGGIAGGEPTKAMLTIRRLNDGKFEVGNGGPRYLTLRTVEIRIYNPDGGEEHGQTSIHEGNARGLAKHVTAAVEDLTGGSDRPACPVWCRDEISTSPAEVFHENRIGETWRGDDSTTISFALDRQDDEDGIGEPHLTILVARGSECAAQETVRLPLDEARRFFTCGLEFVALAEVTP